MPGIRVYRVEVAVRAYIDRSVRSGQQRIVSLHRNSPAEFAGLGIDRVQTFVVCGKEHRVLPHNGWSTNEV